MIWNAEKGDQGKFFSFHSAFLLGDEMNDTGKKGGGDGTRTRGLCRDRVACRCNLLELNGADSPFFTH
jgi:hypothetical protein